MYLKPVAVVLTCTANLAAAGELLLVSFLLKVHHVNTHPVTTPTRDSDSIAVTTPNALEASLYCVTDLMTELRLVESLMIVSLLLVGDG